MAFVNFSTREITAKIVYYGPGLCGKTTTLQYIFDSIVPENKGEMVSLATDVDRTIYFDFLPLKLGKIQNFDVRIQLYTVPGQVKYNATRKLVLKGVDGIVFVADSIADRRENNIISLNNLIENLQFYDIDIADIPIVFQYIHNTKALLIMRKVFRIQFLKGCFSPMPKRRMPQIMAESDRFCQILIQIHGSCNCSTYLCNLQCVGKTCSIMGA